METGSGRVTLTEVTSSLRSMCAKKDNIRVSSALVRQLTAVVTADYLLTADNTLTGKHVYLTSEHIYLTGKYVYLTGKHVYLTGEHIYLTGKHVYLTSEHIYLTGKYV